MPQPETVFLQGAKNGEIAGNPVVAGLCGRVLVILLSNFTNRFLMWNQYAGGFPMLLALVCLSPFGSYGMTPLTRFFMALPFVFLAGCSSSTFTWKEEVALHDGTMLIVTRSHTYDGYGEIGQGRVIGWRSLTFKVPGSGQEVTWRTDSSLSPMALAFNGNTPYVVSTPSTCPGFSKWGRPNPPYVVFRWDSDWRRVPLEELPEGVKDANLLVSTKHDAEKFMIGHGLEYLPAKIVIEQNRTLLDFRRMVIRSRITSGTGTYGGCETR